ncbi:carbonic anhydrase [Lineolata rhizophorae]|uniref:Carbonic anhydrase n=1 Tax=Lineolata rhizophorae TaxID=578093 RepID=A0A6A6P975_9PEZI|nr:carbonic anhydrase [Lineolata rhizophorae]
MASSKTPVQQAVEASNEKYAASFHQGHLALPPAKKYLVVTCMDARIDPAAAFGIALGDAHVIRNAGGNARDALRSIVISEQLLGTNEILIIKHTGCGMITFRNQDALKVVQQNLGSLAKQEAEILFNADFQAFPDIENGVKDDVTFLRDSKLIPQSVTISGWIYDVHAGRVRKVV